MKQIRFKKKNCDRCSDRFTPVTITQKYCSRSCQRLAAQKRFMDNLRARARVNFPNTPPPMTPTPTVLLRPNPAPVALSNNPLENLINALDQQAEGEI